MTAGVFLAALIGLFFYPPSLFLLIASFGVNLFVHYRMERGWQAEAAAIRHLATVLYCFVDEVLRGTNTVERIAASSQVLSALAGVGALCMAATHDIELTELLYQFQPLTPRRSSAFPALRRRFPLSVALLRLAPCSLQDRKIPRRFGCVKALHWY